MCVCVVFGFSSLSLSRPSAPFVFWADLPLAQRAPVRESPLFQPLRHTTHGHVRFHSPVDIARTPCPKRVRESPPRSCSPASSVRTNISDVNRSATTRGWNVWTRRPRCIRMAWTIFIRPIPATNSRRNRTRLTIHEKLFIVSIYDD